MSETSTIPAGIPSADAVEVQSFGATWRASKGKICTGRETEGTYQERPNILGIIRRRGVHDSVTSDQYKKKLSQLECDIETSEGMVYFKTGLLKRETQLLEVSRSVIDFAWGLTQVQDGELIMITAAQGEPWVNPTTGETMSPSTYINFARVKPDPKNPGKFIATAIIKPKRDTNAPKIPMNDQWLALRKELEPGFKPRPNDRKDEEEDHDGGSVTAPSGHQNKLSALMKERNWPMPEQATPEWLLLLARLLNGPTGQPLTALVQHTDDDWKRVYEAFLPITELPAIFVPVKARLDAAAVAAAAVTAPAAPVAPAADYDPFKVP